MAIGTGAAAEPAPVAPGQAFPDAGTSDRAAEEKAACIKNLKAVYEAIQSFEADHRDLPNWLSDLVPQYLADVNALVCPVCRRTGQTEAPPLADPKMASSYIFEFCPGVEAPPDGAGGVGGAAGAVPSSRPSVEPGV